jgi:hypothetical protein
MRYHLNTYLLPKWGGLPVEFITAEQVFASAAAYAKIGTRWDARLSSLQGVIPRSERTPLKRWMRHGSEERIRRYTHLHPKYRKDVIARIPAVFAPIAPVLAVA